MTRLGFLQEVKKVLDVKNYVTEDEKQKKRRNYLQMNQSYVFTADNYIKMIMMLLKLDQKYQ